MVSKIRDAIFNDDFREHLPAYLPIAGIIILAVAFVAISLARAG